MCSDRVANCDQCTFSESTNLQVVCSACATGYHLATLNFGGKICLQDECLSFDVFSGRCTSCSAGFYVDVQTGTCEAVCGTN